MNNASYFISEYWLEKAIYHKSNKEDDTFQKVDRNTFQNFIEKAIELLNETGNGVTAKTKRGGIKYESGYTFAYYYYY